MPRYEIGDRAILLPYEALPVLVERCPVKVDVSLEKLYFILAYRPYVDSYSSHDRLETALGKAARAP